MPTKYIKKIKLGSEELVINDAEARTQITTVSNSMVTTINGHSNVDINSNSVTFADTPISNTEIDDILDDGQLNNSASSGN